MLFHGRSCGLREGVSNSLTAGWVIHERRHRHKYEVQRHKDQQELLNGAEGGGEIGSKSSKLVLW